MLPAVKDPANACLERAAAKLIEDRVTILSIMSQGTKGQLSHQDVSIIFAELEYPDKTGRKFGWCLQVDFLEFLNQSLWLILEKL